MDVKNVLGESIRRLEAKRNSIPIFSALDMEVSSLASTTRSRTLVSIYQYNNSCLIKTKLAAKN